VLGCFLATTGPGAGFAEDLSAADLPAEDLLAEDLLAEDLPAELAELAGELPDDLAEELAPGFAAEPVELLP
jgi:hypothetical protein